MTRILWTMVILLSVVAAAICTLIGQSLTAQISATVLDSSGAAVPQAGGQCLC